VLCIETAKIDTENYNIIGGKRMENEIQMSKAPADLIAMALDRQADPNVLSKLMDLQERWEAQKARKEYVLAMTAFKREAPAVLKKNDRVDFTTQKGRTVYNYANLGSIVQEMTALLGKHELSAAWETAQNDKGMISVSCHITHSAGHRETVTLEGPPDISGNKNAIQAIGSAVTYLQRYTLLAALGLATTEEDDDGRGGKEKPPIQQPQKKNGDKPPEPPTFPSNTVAVSQVEIKTGKGPKGPWTLYMVHAAGEKYNTFSDTFGKLAQRSIDEKINAVISWSETEKGKKLENIVLEEPPLDGDAQ
jgi:hypothetical protein